MTKAPIPKSESLEVKMKIFNFIIITLFLAIVSCKDESKKSFPSVELITNCEISQDLPVVTHWSNTEYIKPGATDQINLNNTSPIKDGIKYIYNYNYLPQVDQYIGENYSIRAISDNQALAWISENCKKTNQSIKLWRPKTFEGQLAIQDILERAPRLSGTNIIISGLTSSKSMYTVFLPANWSPENLRETPVPIIFNGFYDVNENLFLHEGKFMAELIAKSVQENGTGAIGVLWNGAGAIASRTINPNAWKEFEAIISLVSQLGGDRHRILGFGGSRGGVTSLQMASNPNPHNYTFRYIDSSVPPAHIGSIAQVASPTIPYLLTAIESSSGISGSHKRSFIYPDVNNSLNGLNSIQTHLKILTGISDPTLVDEQYSLGSSNFIQSLKNSKTEIFLEIGSHDIIVPSFSQQWLYRQYLDSGIPVELKYNYLAGHYTALDLRQNRLINQMKVYTHHFNGTHPKVNSGARSFYKVDSLTGKIESLQTNKFLFTMEFPRIVSPEVDGLIILTGEPQTEVELTIQFPNTKVDSIYNAKLNTYGYFILKFDPSSIPSGNYQIKSVRIKKPTDELWKTISLNQRTYKLSQPNEPLIIENLSRHPEDISGFDFSEIVVKRYLGANRENVLIPEIQNVNYGIIEEIK